MATFNSFEDIEAWKRGHQVALKIYQISNSSKLEKDFPLRDQMRKSAISIPSNIAEGFDRRSHKEFINFLNYSKGSGSELRSQLILAKDLGYVDSEQFHPLNQELIELNKMIGGLMKYLSNRNS